MYVSNRKNAYKVVRRYKRSPRIKLLSKHGVIFTVTQAALDAGGYREVKNKPAAFSRRRI